MSAIPIALAATLLAACGSSRPADSTATTEPQTEPADAGVPLGRPSQPGGDAGTPELPPTVVKSSVLEGQRLSGNPRIEPDPVDQRALSSTGTKVVVAAKFCLDAAGHVSTAKLLRSSGLASYDDKILREMKSWTFRPIVAEGGQPVDVCTVVTFIYSPAPPAAPAP